LDSIQVGQSLFLIEIIKRKIKPDIFLARFDLTVLAPYLLPELQRRNEKVTLLKKNSSYFSITTDSLIFKDVYFFTPPTSMAKYLKQNGVIEEKSVFPYQAFNSVEEMRQQIQFPSHQQFFSNLKQTNISTSEYSQAKNEYDRRRLLPNKHPNKINNFVDWLVHYNIMDVVPLSQAINNSFDNFFHIFGIDPSWCLSLPKFAQMCMFKEYKSSAPLSYSFNFKMDHLRTLFRENLQGGLVNVYHRMTDLTNTTGIPKVASIAPSGDRFTRICFFDFNSLYLYCQLLEFPSTPGNLSFFLFYKIIFIIAI
jgi:hypothetical protein